MLFFIFVAFNITLTFFPFTEWDSLTYHLPLAKIYATTHSVSPPSWMYHAQNPQLGEVLFGVGYLFQDQSSAETFVSLFLIFFHHFFFIAFYLFAKRIYNATIALYALVIIYTLPEISIYITSPYVDIMRATYQFLAFAMLFYAFFDKNLVGKRPYAFIILAFIFSGINAGIKYPGLFMVFFTVLVIICFCFIDSNRFKTKEMLYTTIVGIVLASFFFFPMYLKNFYFTNNPVWPFLTQIFQNSIGFNPELALAWNRLYEGPFPIPLVKSLYLPLYMTFTPLSFGSIYGIGPLFLMFAPLACFFLISKKFSFPVQTCKHMFFYLLTIVIFLGIWYKTYYGYRLFFFGFVLLALVVAYTIDFINKKFPRIRLVILLLLIAVILSNFFAYLVIYRAALPTLLLQKPIDNILYERVQIAEVDDYINTNTSEDAKILLANDVRGYYIERNYVWGDPMNSLLYVDYRTIKNSEQLYITLKKLGITHIRITLFSQYNYTYGFVSEYYGKHVTELYSELFHDYSILVYEKNNVLLYELK